MGKAMIKALIIIVALGHIYACNSVKGLEKYYLAEPNMELDDHSICIFEKNAAMYREGASGGNGGKAGGGCGCH